MCQGAPLVIISDNIYKTLQSLILVSTKIFFFVLSCNIFIRFYPLFKRLIQFLAFFFKMNNPAITFYWPRTQKNKWVYMHEKSRMLKLRLRGQIHVRSISRLMTTDPSIRVQAPLLFTSLFSGGTPLS